MATTRTAEQYLGLTLGENPSVNPSGLVVKPDVAIQQRKDEELERLRAEIAARGGDGPQPNGEANDSTAITGYDPGIGTGDPSPVDPIAPARPVLRRFHGSVELNSLRTGRDAGQIAENVIAHLEGLTGARVRVTLEIEADIPDGASEQVVRTVSENARTLHFNSYGFEEE